MTAQIAQTLAKVVKQVAQQAIQKAPGKGRQMLEKASEPMFKR